MNAKKIIDQYNFAFEFSVILDNKHITVQDILDCLASAGLKLQELSELDYDEEGVSLPSKAYMYSIFERIESYHHNIKNSPVSNSEDSDEDFNDYIEDDLDPEEFNTLNDFDTDKDA